MNKVGGDRRLGAAPTRLGPRGRTIHVLVAAGLMQGLGTVGRTKDKGVDGPPPRTKTKQSAGGAPSTARHRNE